MGEKFCSYCRTYQPEENFTYVVRGSGGRRFNKAICRTCKDQRSRHRTVEQRDAFGRTVTEHNWAQQSRFQTIRQQKEDKVP